MGAAKDGMKPELEELLYCLGTKVFVVLFCL